MNKSHSSTIQLLFTDGIEITFNTKISKIIEDSHESIVTVYNTSPSILTFPNLTDPYRALQGLVEPCRALQGSVTLHTYPAAPIKSLFYARAYREPEPDRPISSIYTNPYFRGDGLGSVSILKHLQNTVGIENAYTLSVVTPDGIEEFAQTLLGVRRVKGV